VKLAKGQTIDAFEVTTSEAPKETKTEKGSPKANSPRVEK